MANPLRFRSVRFHNYKALGSYVVPLRDINVLVGPNNTGKSTVIGAFRILDAALRRARARSPEVVRVGKGTRRGWTITPEAVPVSLENVHTNYGTSESSIEFDLGPDKRLTLHFPADGGCLLLADSDGAQPKTPAEFRAEFPVTVGIVPVLGPVEHEEPLVSQETVRLGLATHRASRHFRCYWHYFPEGFNEFASRIRGTWTGMEIKPPELVSGEARLMMFCSEHRLDRELYWAGSGFQVWCQLLTHIMRSRDATILAVDEPEIYLHPDLQRQLFGLLSDLGIPVILGTHSTEIVSEADPSHVLLIDKSKKSARRLRDPDDSQSALDIIGSSHNIVLTRLARQRRLLFVEGDDFQLIRRFAARLGLVDLARKVGIVDVPVGGFGNWTRVTALAWGFENALDSKFALAAVFDRDFHCAAEIDSILGELRSSAVNAHVLAMKEIENYLLVPAVLDRAIVASARDSTQRGARQRNTVFDVRKQLDQITSSMKTQVMSKYIGASVAYQRQSGRDSSTVTEETLRWFDERWTSLDRRLCIVPGKEVLAILNSQLQATSGISITAARIIAAFSKDELPIEISDICTQLEAFRIRPA